MAAEQKTEVKKKESNLATTWRRLRRNKGAMIGLTFLCIMILLAVFANFVAPYGYDDQDYSATFQFPNSAHWFGTDNLGRDLLSRVIYGGRISLRIGIISVGIASICGCTLGAIAGFYGGKIDNTIMRLLDIIQSIPGILFSIAIAACLGPGITNCMIAIGIGTIPGYARMLRGSILSEREKEYVEAAKAINASDARIIIKHVVPNSLSPTIIQMTMGVASSIMMAATLSFIGLGCQPPLPEWGAMLSGGRAYIRNYPYMCIVPGVAIILTVLSLNMLGDGLRDALDPRLKS